MDILVQITVNIDYPDEDVEPVLYDDLAAQTEAINERISKLLDTADRGRIISEGLSVSIIGRPNVGKSSLLNALLRETRAIVTEIPGTTRDTIEETTNIDGIPVRITDTAGIRDTNNVIEKKGIEKSKESFNRADLLIFMLDGSCPLTEEDLSIAEHIGDRLCIVLVNKQDIATVVEDSEIRTLLPHATIMHSSMIDVNSTSDVENVIVSMVYGGKVKQNESLIVTNVRHQQLLSETDSSLHDARSMIIRKEPLEFIEIDINHAYEQLGEILGEEVSDDIINEVFSRFCLGK